MQKEPDAPQTAGKAASAPVVTSGGAFQVETYLNEREAEYTASREAAKERAQAHNAAMDTELRNVERLTGALGMLAELRSAMADDDTGPSPAD